MASREDEKDTAIVFSIIGLVLCGFAVGSFLSPGFGFLFVGLPLLSLGIHRLIKN